MSLLLGLPLGIFRMLWAVVMTCLRLLPLVILIVVAIFVYKKHKKVAQQMYGSEETPPKKAKKRGPSFTGPVVTVDYKEVREEDETIQPESPAAFGYKPGWLAVRAKDPETVIKALGLRGQKRANWTTGLAGIRANRWFVSPSLDGWVLVIGSGDRGISQERFSQISRCFSEAQAYVSNSKKSMYAWAWYHGGDCVRAYAICRGQVVMDEGELTREEIALGFGRFPRREGGTREGFPDGDAVLSIAAAWGIDPMMEGASYPPDLGWLCTTE